MANLSIPDAKNIRPLESAVIRNAVAGGAMDIGDLVYVASDGDWEQADGNASATAFATGIVVGSDSGETGILADEGIAVCVFGPVAGFASLTPGGIGYTSDDTGKIEDAAGTVTHTIGWCQTDEIFFVQPGLRLPTS